MLPKWSPELREIRFENSMVMSSGTSDGLQLALQHDGIPAMFEKLKILCLDRMMDDVYDILIEDIVKLSPHLEFVEMMMCQNNGNHMCRSIANYAPQIETMRYDGGMLNHESFISNCDQMKNLKSLSLRFYSCITDLGSANIKYVMSVIKSIVRADIRLEHLECAYFDLRNECDQFAEEVSKLKSLKTLRLFDVVGLTPAHFLRMCSNFGELTEVYVSKPMRRGKCMFSPANLWRF